MKTPLFGRIAVLASPVALFLQSSVLLRGQALNPPAPVPPAAAKAAPSTNEVAAKEEAVELSPFFVKAETGWVATETMSGTRLRSDLRDVPSQIETFTKDFMEDLGLTNIEDALIYSANAENQFEYIVSNAETTAFYTNSANRVRGIGAGTNSMNLFRSSLAPDNYNIDSVSVVSGPNSTLFGMGGSSGTFDNNSARATMTNKTGLRFQYSSEDSRRVSLDLNRVLIKNRLALRVMGLWKNEETHSKPNHDEDKRFTGTVTFKPFQHTVLRARFEKVDRDFNRAPRTLAYDYVTPWLNANRIPGSPYTSAMPAYDNRTAVPSNVAATTRIFGANNVAAVFITNSPGDPVMGWGQAVQVLNPSAATIYGVPDSSLDPAARATFRDSSIVPIDINPFGDLKSTALGGKNTSVFLEQKLATNLFLELAGNWEDSYQNTLGGRGQGISAIYVDANQYLPALLPGATTYKTNPNFGRYYVDYQPNHNPAEYVYRDYRATLSYELDLTRQTSPWLRWLGRHRPVLVAVRNDSRTRSQLNFSPRVLDNPTLPGRALTAQTANNWAIQATRALRIRSYLDQDFQPVAPPNSLEGDYRYVDGTGQAYSAIGGFLTGLSLPNGKRLANSSSGLNASWNKTDTWLWAHQGQFFPDRHGNPRLILTFGYREDKARSATADVASRTQDAGVGRTGLYPYYKDSAWDAFGPAERGLTRTKGAVLRPWPWLSLTYSESSTFDVSTQYFSPTGVRYPGSGGEGKDYGVRLDLWSNRLSVRVNRYENSAGPSRVSNSLDDPFRTPTNALEVRVRQLDPTLAPPANWFSSPVNYGYDAYHPFSYKVSEGYELSIDLRPLPNWNIRLNGAKTEAKEDEIGRDWVAWLRQRVPVWEGVVAKNGEVDASGRPVTWATADIDSASATENRTLKQYYEEQVVGTGLALMQASEGRVSDGLRGKRLNLITNYRFTGGALKGFSVGGAVRWRPAPVTGYPVMVNSVGTKMLDVQHAFYGKQELPVDLSAGYRGRMKYFGGVGYTVQLNIRNALDQSDPIPVSAYTNGAVYRYATVEPRLFIVSCGFDF